jgi:hypothetical protein
VENFDTSSVVFVADLFLGEYGGGAERTTDALLQTSPYSVSKIKSDQVSQELIQKGIQKTWVFFNFRNMDHNLIPHIVGNLHYFIVEYDYKFCQYRSLDLHLKETGKNCDCFDTNLGKIVSAFYHGSEHIFWMSKKQSEIYHENFLFLKDNNQTVLSSVFSIKDLDHISNLFNKRKKEGFDENKWAVIDGNSWIKGVDESIASVNNAFPNSMAEVIGGLSYYDLLGTLSKYRGLSFQPLGADTCPRTVIEAKLLGLELLLNNNVQHLSEEWFSKDKDEIEDYLLSRHEVFWGEIKSFIEREITVSGYTTTYNVITNDYPWKESIESMLYFCDEVVVLDGGSSDGTFQELLEMKKINPKLIVKQFNRDWDDERFALFDHQQKALARTLCNGNFCWQMDIDEIVHKDDKEKIKQICRSLPKSVDVVCLPVIDFWGKEDKVRLDVHPWKWRLSRNKPYITHDIPADHRRYDMNGNLFSAGSDGCDYVHFASYQLIPNVNFYTNQHEEIRQFLLNNREDERYEEILDSYQSFMLSAIKELPAVYHYSWFDIKRKIHNYRDFWSKFHASLYNKEVVDNAENNKFFNKPWSEVSEDEIESTALILNDEFGGWIFHKQLNLNDKTHWYKLGDNPHPDFIKNWLERRK